MTPDERKRLVEEYLKGNYHRAGEKLFENWYRQFQIDENLHLKDEEVQAAVHRIGGHLRKKNKEVIPLRRNVFRITAAAASLILLAAVTLAIKGGLIYDLIYPVKVLEFATTAGETKEIVLSDGSLIHLNESSRIAITNRFSHAKQREVNLEGEAFFEVKRDPDRPFLVFAGKAVVRVLGTKFNVSGSRGDSMIVVAVKEGLVSLQNKNSEEKSRILLSKNEGGILNSSGEVLHNNNSSINNYLSWMNGKLEFDNTPLLEVTTQLQNIYHVPIKLNDPKLNNLRLTLEYPFASIDRTMEVVCQGLNLQYVYEKGTIKISKSKVKNTQ